MRFLIFLALALLVVWLWRSSRRSGGAADAPTTPPPTTTPPSPQDMVRCAHCGVHLPHGEAVVGRIGLYCSNEHRQTAEP